MKLSELLKDYSNLNIDEKRCVTDDYVWLVFFNKEVAEWNKIFTSILGPAVKPAGANPSQDDLRLTKDYGGVRREQTLFKKEFDDATVIAMFWPWQDNLRTTLKMILIERK